MRIAIVGGGVLGASAALHLAQAGKLLAACALGQEPAMNLHAFDPLRRPASGLRGPLR